MLILQLCHYFNLKDSIHKNELTGLTSEISKPFPGVSHHSVVEHMTMHGEDPKFSL